MAIISRLTGEDVSTRYEAVCGGHGGPVFSEYEANDRLLDRVVRVRALNALLAQPDVIDALSRDLVRLSHLSHPVIERVLDILDVRSTVAMVVEAPRGAGLDQRIVKVGAFPVAYALDVVITVAEALDAAHRGGVLHGNLRASDICISPEGVIKLSGLGVAPALALLPPEQLPDGFTGDRPSVGRDVAAFGLVLFQILAGTLTSPAANSTPAASAFPRNVPGSLVNLVQCLRMPGGPYQGMDGVLHDLRALRDAIRHGRPLPVITVPTPEPARPSRRRKPAPASEAPRKAVQVVDPAPARAPVPTPVAAQSPILVPTPASVPVPTPAAAQSLAPVVSPASAPVPTPAPTTPLPAAVPASPAAVAPQASPAPRIGGAPAIRRRSAEPAPPSEPARRRRTERRPFSLFRYLAAQVAWLVFFILLIPALFFGGFFYLTWLSSTPEVTVPVLRGQPVQQARTHLNDMGLKLQVIGPGVFDSSMPPGSILTQIPDAGQHTKAPRTILVTVSNGSRTVKVPSVAGMPLSAAMEALRQAGLQPQNNGEVSSATVPNGDIVRQWPPAGQVVPRGSEASVRVSGGPSEQDLEAMSPSTPQDRNVNFQIPADPHPGHTSTHQVAIKEVDENGDEKTLWQGTASSGETVDENVTLDAFSQLKIYLDGKELKLRLDTPEEDESTNTLASASGAIPGQSD